MIVQSLQLEWLNSSGDVITFVTFVVVKPGVMHAVEYADSKPND